MRLSFSTPAPDQAANFEAMFKENEGQLAVDVIETASEIIIRSAIAGIDEANLVINVEDDVVTIRGTRHEDPLPSGASLHYGECFWGPFSRSIILPCAVSIDTSKAILKNGILTLRLPKRVRDQRIPIECV